MATKKKGTRAERELLHTFWDNTWGAVRIAGSGSIPLPAPDILAGNKKRWLAIECKSIKNKSKFFYLDEIKQLKQFSEAFGAEPWLAIRFDNIGWYFLHTNTLTPTKSGNFNISLNLAKEKGINFEDLIKR